MEEKVTSQESGNQSRLHGSAHMCAEGMGGLQNQGSHVGVCVAYKAKTGGVGRQHLAFPVGFENFTPLEFCKSQVLHYATVS